MKEESCRRQPLSNNTEGKEKIVNLLSVSALFEVNQTTIDLYIGLGFFLFISI